MSKLSQSLILLVAIAHPILAQETLPRLEREQATLMASEEFRELVAQLSDYRTKLDSSLAEPGSDIRLFARLGKIRSLEGDLVPTDSVVRVPDSDSWPSNTETSFVVLEGAGVVLAVQEVPTSASGDWYNAYTHYFDDAGRTVAFKRYSGFFNGCAVSPAKEYSIYYYDPEGHLIQKEYRLEDRTGKSMSPSDCEFYHRYNYEICDSWSTLAARNGLAQFFALSAR